MSSKFEVLATAGPLDKILRDKEGRLRSYSEIMYDYYSWDARIFAVEQIKRTLDNPATYNSMPQELQDKARGILILELVSKFCESAEDLAAFGISFATELYMDAVSPEEVWMRVAQHETGDIINFYRDITLRGPDYFANFYGYPPLELQENDARMSLFRSCRQLAGYMGMVADTYMKLRELHNAYKHGMRVFFGTLTEKGKQSIAIHYVDKEAKVKVVAFPAEMVEEIYILDLQLGRVLGGILRWHATRIQVTITGSMAIPAPLFGQGNDKDRELSMLVFPAILEARTILVNRGEQIALERKGDIAKIPRGDVIAIDVDSRVILPFHSPNLREVIWRSLGESPGARLVLRRITDDGKIGPY